MLKIKLTDKYYLESDKLNYILTEKKIAQSGKHKGEEIFINVGYFTTIKHLLSKLIEYEIKESDLTILKEIKTLIENISTTISNNMSAKTL